MRRFLRVLTSAAFLLLPFAVGAKSLWLIEEGRLTRMDAGSGALATVATAGYVYNVAPVGNGDAWVLTDNALVLLGADLAEAARAPLTPSEAQAIGPMVADRSDGGVWFASGTALVYLDGTGARVREIAVDDKVSAIAIA